MQSLDLCFLTEKRGVYRKKVFIQASLRYVVHKLGDSNHEETLACQEHLLRIRGVFGFQTVLLV